MTDVEPAQRPLQSSPHPQPAESHAFSYHGETSSFFVLVLKNLALTLITFGIYMPWAKTERRKYLWQNIEIAGHRLRYHGTGEELLFGYLKVLLAYILLVVLQVLAGQIGKTAALIVQIAAMLILFPLIPYAIWSSRRYLFSRTSWRGIRFRQEGSAGPYVRTFMLGCLLTVLSLGFYAPFWLNKLHKLLIDHCALGTQRLSYRGTGGEAFRIGLKGLMLTILTFGIYGFWYQAEMARFHLRNTWFDQARGRLDLTGSDLFKLAFLQIFAVTFSLGFAFPWVTTYVLRFTLSRIQFEGPVAFARIYRAETDGDAAADGLADALDVGLGL